MEKTVIGIVGEKGSGKGTFVKLLQELIPGKTIARTTFSTVLKDTLDIWNLSETRENFQKLVVSMRETFGRDVLAHAVKKRIASLEGVLIVIDGMRWKADEEMIRSFNKNFIVYVTADPKIRFERTKLRGEKAGEKEATYEEFMEEEKVASEVEIPGIASNADFKIDNNDGLEEFRSQVKVFCEKLLAPLV